MKKAIIFGPEGPDSSAEGVVTAKFAWMLYKQGWNIYWICHDTKVNYGNDIKEVPYHVISVRNDVIQKLTRAFRRIPILKYVYLLDSFIWSYKAYRRAKKIHKQIHIDYIFSRIMPQYGHLPALMLKKSSDIPWIANWSDPMPREKAPRPYGYGVDAPISKFERLYISQICKYADSHTFPSNRLKEYYLHYLPTKPEKCFTLPHIINKDVFPSVKVHEKLRLYHIGGGLIERNPTLLFRALRNVLDRTQYSLDKLEINFIGPIEGNVVNIAKKEGVSDIIHLLGRKPYNEALNYICAADILLLIEAPMKEGIFLPSKVADILGYHKPIFAISPQKGVMKDLISQYGGGIVVDCLSLSSIERGLEQLFDDWVNNKLDTAQYNTQNLYKQFTEKNVYLEVQRIIDEIK